MVLGGISHNAATTLAFFGLFIYGIANEYRLTIGNNRLEDLLESMEKNVPNAADYAEGYKTGRGWI